MTLTALFLKKCLPQDRSQYHTTNLDISVCFQNHLFCTLALLSYIHLCRRPTQRALSFHNFELMIYLCSYNQMWWPRNWSIVLNPTRDSQTSKLWCWGGYPVGRWYLVANSLLGGTQNCSSMSRYMSSVIVASAKKMGQIILSFIKPYQMFSFGLFCTNSR